MNYNKILSYIIYKDNKKTKYWDSLIHQMKVQTKNKKYPNIVNYLLSLYEDSESSSETLYRMMNNIIIRPVCCVCGKHVNYDRKHLCFRKYCSNKCGSNTEETLSKRKKTCLEKYGDENYNNFDKYKKTCLEKYGVDNVWKSDVIKDKIKKHNLKKYGVEYSLQDNDVREKGKKTKLEKYGDENYSNREKAKETCMKKYGVKYILSSKEIQEKSKQTCLKKYNSNTWRTSIEGRNKLSEIISSNEVQLKINNTKKENNSFNKSRPEIESYELLKNIFPDCEHHKRDDNRYPFECDLYIKSLDLFIELNYHWTHNDHLFNENNIDDINILNKWKEKSIKSKFYKNAIETWTIRDVNKYNIAKKNNLNYIIFYSQKEFIDWLKQYEEK